MAMYDFGKEEITNLKKDLAKKEKVFQELLTMVFATNELRNYWRRKYGIAEVETVDNGDMP